MIASSTGGWKTAIPRVVLAVFIGFMTAIPITLKVFDDRIRQHMEQESRTRQQNRLSKQRDRSGLPRVNTRIDSLEQQKGTVQAEIRRAKRIQECELTGVKIEGLPCTGVRGDGKVYNNAVENEEQARNQLEEIEQELKRLRSKRENLRGEIDKGETGKPKIIRDPLAQYMALKEITDESSAAKWFYYIAHLIVIAFELSVVLLKMLREEDDYDSALSDYQDAKKEIDARIIQRYKEEVLEEIDQNPRSLPRPTLADLLEKAGRPSSGSPGGHFSDDPEEPEEANSEGRDAERDPGSDDQDSGDQEDGPASRNGQVLYSWTGSIVVGTILIVLLESCTPIAPLQRLAGNTVNVLPDATHMALIGSTAAERYDNLKQLINRQGQRGIVAADGTILTRPTESPDFPETLRTYLVQAENHRFWDCYVIDWWRLLGAIRTNFVELDLVSGGSGLIQQLAGNVVLHNGLTMRFGSPWEKVLAKLQETTVAMGLRDKYSAEKLLQFYLKGAYLGRGGNGPIRGFEEASWAYFDTRVGALSKPQQLALVSLLKGPNKYAGSPAAFKTRYETVINVLKNNGAITRNEAERLRQDRPRLSPPKGDNTLQLATRHARKYLLRHTADSAGMIHSTVSAPASRAAFRVLRRTAQNVEQKTGVSDLEGFVLVAHRGKLLTMIGSRSGRGFNRVDSITAYRPGSLSKPPLFAEYLAQGGSTSDRLPVQPRTFTLPNGRSWTVHNFSDRYDSSGPMPVARCLSRSINACAGSLAVGPVATHVRDRLVQAGFDDPFPHASSFLGAEAVRPLRRFRLLQAFVRPYGQVPLRFRMDQTEAVRRANVWPKEAARKIALTMSYAVEDGTLTPGRRCCGWMPQTHRGKTGTAEEYAAASLFLSRPGGLSVLMGLFSSSGEGMTYVDREGGVTGASLVPYVDELLRSEALEDRTNHSFRIRGNLERQLLRKPLLAH